MGLKEDIEKFKNGLKRSLVQQKRMAARIALKKLLYKSPARTGSYMSSHNVGISKTASGRGIGKGFTEIKTDRRDPTNTEFVPPMPQAQKLALAAELYSSKKNYISRAKFEDAITIYNNIPYADRIEYLGWYDLFPWAKNPQPPYHVYRNTISEMEVIMPMVPNLVIKGTVI